jgi:hypothetical protein
MAEVRRSARPEPVSVPDLNAIAADIKAKIPDRLARERYIRGLIAAMNKAIEDYENEQDD